MKHILNAVTKQLIDPVAKTSSTTTTANLDTLGADFATVVVQIGAQLNTNGAAPTIKLSSADVTNSSSFATITANLTPTTLTVGQNIVYHVDSKYAKRYLQVSCSTATATNDNLVFSALGILTKVEQKPAGTASMVSTTNDTVVIV